MKAPDKHIIDRTLSNTATPEEARQVIRWFSTPEGANYLSSLMDEDIDTIQPGNEELYAERTIPSDEMYQYIMKRIHLQERKRMLFRAAAILIPFLFLLAQFWYIDKRIDLFADSGYEEIYVPKGERMQLISRTAPEPCSMPRHASNTRGNSVSPNAKSNWREKRFLKCLQTKIAHLL